MHSDAFLTLTLPPADHRNPVGFLCGLKWKRVFKLNIEFDWQCTYWYHVTATSWDQTLAGSDEGVQSGRGAASWRRMETQTRSLTGVLLHQMATSRKYPFTFKHAWMPLYLLSTQVVLVKRGTLLQRPLSSLVARWHSHHSKVLQCSTTPMPQQA